ncbi:hypothetical protein BKA81DRAFT_380648 [Phyllosticta paracitricarpa]|uniref:Chromo domain-containing protein n=1 Tax=Phyllosticta paracitricarpa TaxID=2016321 RepID=A0ABR1N2H5_9PEZI
MPSTWRDDTSECSDISLASTVESEPAEDYIVDCVVARRPDGDGDYEYLVRWEGYPEHRNTWEPVSSFLSEQAVKELWKERLQNERLGKTPPFDLDAWERDQYERQLAAERRKEERRKKRADKAAKAKRAINVPEKRKLDASPSGTHHPTKGRQSKRPVVLDESSDDDIPLVKSISRQPRLRDKTTDIPVSDLKESRPSTPSSSLFVPNSDLPHNPPPPKPRPIAKMIPLSQSTSAKEGKDGAPVVQPTQPKSIFQRSKPVPRERNPGPARSRAPRKQSSGHIRTNAELFRLLNATRGVSEEPSLEDLTFIDPKTGGQDMATHDALVRQKNLQQEQ